jgi:hypothetical protein
MAPVHWGSTSWAEVHTPLTGRRRLLAACEPGNASLSALADMAEAGEHNKGRGGDRKSQSLRDEGA